MEVIHIITNQEAETIPEPGARLWPSEAYPTDQLLPSRLKLPKLSQPSAPQGMSVQNMSPWKEVGVHFRFKPEQESRILRNKSLTCLSHQSGYRISETTCTCFLSCHHEPLSHPLRSPTLLCPPSSCPKLKRLPEF